MSKILESEFRKELYKNLIEAGYEKLEAQKIVGKKYSSALQDELIGDLQQLIDNIKGGNYEFTIKADDFNNGLTELTKLKDLLKE